MADLSRHLKDFSTTTELSLSCSGDSFKCSLVCQPVKASGCEGGGFGSPEGKKASVNHDGAEREELKLMKS